MNKMEPTINCKTCSLMLDNETNAVRYYKACGRKQKLKQRNTVIVIFLRKVNMNNQKALLVKQMLIYSQHSRQWYR